MIATTDISNSDEILLESVETENVGIQYYDGEVQAGEEVYFEREPDNRHDRNSIRVDNLDFDQIVSYSPKITLFIPPQKISLAFAIFAASCKSNNSEYFTKSDFGSILDFNPDIGDDISPNRM